MASHARHQPTPIAHDEAGQHVLDFHIEAEAVLRDTHRTYHQAPKPLGAEVGKHSSVEPRETASHGLPPGPIQTSTGQNARRAASLSDRDSRCRLENDFPPDFTAYPRLERDLNRYVPPRFGDPTRADTRLSRLDTDHRRMTGRGRSHLPGDRVESPASDPLRSNRTAVLCAPGGS
jgi:hypothetical protein